MGCMGCGGVKKRSQRKGSGASAQPQNAISQKLQNQLRLQNGQSITPIKKYRPQYQHM